MTVGGLVVIVGAPRSGTTWLQQLLCSHPSIASPQETHLFHEFLGPLFEKWERQRQWADDAVAAIELGKAPVRRLVGLPAILDDEQFDDLARNFVAAIVDRSLEAKPGASVVLEKTPSNSMRTDLIDRLLPGVRFIHIVRDPREVVESLLDAGPWGGNWAPKGPTRAARMWREHFLGARRAARFGDRYVEIRLEDLRRDTAGVVARLFEFCGVSAIPDAADATAPSEATVTSGAYALAPRIAARLRGTAPAEPLGFRRGPDEARPGLDGRGRLVVERELGPFLRDLGYTHDASWVALPVASRIVASAGLDIRDRAVRAGQALMPAARVLAKEWGSPEQGRVPPQS